MKVGRTHLTIMTFVPVVALFIQDLIIINEVAIGAKEGVHQEEAIVERVEFHCHHVLKNLTPFQDLKRFNPFMQVWVFWNRFEIRRFMGLIHLKKKKNHF